jgi:hypothetical protein
VSLDRGHVGFSLPTFSVTVTQDRLTRFNEAIHPGISSDLAERVPLTFLKVLEGEGGSSRKILEAMEVPLQRILHAEQQFDYFAPIRVGETVTVGRRISEIYEKKGGAIEFIVIESQFTDPVGRRLAASRQVIMLRNRTAVR